MSIPTSKRVKGRKVVKAWAVLDEKGEIKTSDATHSPLLLIYNIEARPNKNDVIVPVEIIYL